MNSWPRPSWHCILILTTFSNTYSVHRYNAGPRGQYNTIAHKNLTTPILDSNHAYFASSSLAIEQAFLDRMSSKSIASYSWNFTELLIVRPRLLLSAVSLAWPPGGHAPNPTVPMPMLFTGGKLNLVVWQYFVNSVYLLAMPTDHAQYRKIKFGGLAVFC